MASTLSSQQDSVATHPLDLVERVVTENEWSFERSHVDEMAVEMPGQWSAYYLYFSWRPDVRMMQLTCAFDIRVPQNKRSLLHGLLAAVNERMCLGHFDLWSEEGLPMFRHVVPLRGVAGIAPEQLEDLIEFATGECDRFYPAFQLVLWGGKDPAEAISLCLIDPVGEA